MRDDSDQNTDLSLFTQRTRMNFFNAFIRGGCTTEDYTMVGALCIWAGCLYAFSHLTYASGSTILGFVVGGYSATVIIYSAFFVVVTVELISMQSVFLFLLYVAVHVLSHYFAWVYAIPGNSMPTDAYIGGAFLFSLFMKPAGGMVGVLGSLLESHLHSQHPQLVYSTFELPIPPACSSYLQPTASSRTTTRRASLSTSATSCPRFWSSALLSRQRWRLHRRPS